MMAFDDKKKQAAMIIKEYLPNSPMEEIGDDNSIALETAAVGFIQAIEKKDPKAVAEAFQAMFDIAESAPHEEYEDEEFKLGEKIEY